MVHLIHVLIFRQEILEDQNDPVSLKFVKWLNRKKIQQTYQEHGATKATQRLLLELDSEVRGTQERSNGGWECLPEIPEMSLS
jgi:hypothetical protein